MREPPVIVNIDRRRLIDALDSVADVAGAIENNADQPAGPDHDELITSLRQIIIDLYFEIEAPGLLG